MLHYDVPLKIQQFSELTSNRTIKGKIDLIVLRYMAQQVLFTVRTMGPTAGIDMEMPLTFDLMERKSSLHRIMLYKPQELLGEETISFVGFVSAWQESVDEAVRNELYRMDQHIYPALLRIPGLLGYSSLELRPGRWFNLVLLRSLDSKSHLKESGAHQYAAYKLAPRIYSWIRLHNGVFPGGLVAMAPSLLTTKHYSYHEEEKNFRMYAVTYAQRPAEGEKERFRV